MRTFQRLMVRIAHPTCCMHISTFDGAHSAPYLLVVAMMLWQPLAFAADDLAKQDPFASDSTASLFAEIPSVYSASKYEQKVTKAPASISIVTEDEIKKYGYRTFGQVLSSLRGFYNTSDRAYGYAGARGFGLPSDYNSRLLLLIDGHRYNDSMFDAFDSSEGFPVDIDIIKRIEVVRGPSSSLYGTSAVFGVINIITKRGRDQNGANVKFTYGSNDTHKTSLSAGRRFSNGLEAFVSGTFYDSQGYNKLFYKDFDTPTNNVNNGLSIGNDGERDRKLMLKAAYGGFTFQGLHLNRNKDVPTAAFGGIFNSHSQTYHDQATFFELKYDHTFENQLNLQSRVSYNNYRFKGALPLPVDPQFIRSRDNASLVNSDWWRFEVEASKLVWNDHHITVGGQYQDNFNQFQTFFNPKDTLLDKDVSTYQWALFAQDDYSITDTLSLNAGVRFDYYSIFGSTINPRAGLIYNPWQSTTFKLLYGQAFRAPNQAELHNTVGSTAPNPDLQPEKLDTLEFIVEHYFTQQLRAEFNVFHTKLTDNIRSAPSPVDKTKSQYQNIGDVESIGVETQIENTWGDGFQGRLSYSWQETVNQKNQERLTNSPEHMIKLNLIAPLWKDKVFVGFETQFMSSRKTPAKAINGNVGGRVNDFVISNLTVYTQNWVKGLELSAGAYNLFDERYFDPASADHIQNAIQQDGLQFRIKASYDY